MMIRVTRPRFAQALGLALVMLLGVLQARATFAADAIDASRPQALIESSSRVLFADLDANRAKYRKDISQLYKVVDTVFLPHVDVDFAAQQVLGKHWRTATPDQRKRFVAAFYRSLLTTYGDALVDFTGDRMKVLPFQGDASQPRASVRTEIRRSNGASVAVAYSLRKDAAGAWKVWDVVIEGISYVKSFREDFGLEVDQKGLDALLQRLEASAAKSGARAP
ncbi:MAG: ABC transporter substrate-binding protein [Proteobacteria bacterium]|jgi:phospholipid transport system substrate-binding protein|nr:ABC transporter substrate-binding protein [Pseudomonadota bacterium]